MHYRGLVNQSSKGVLSLGSLVVKFHLFLTGLWVIFPLLIFATNPGCPRNTYEVRWGAMDKKYRPEIRLPVACVDEYAGKVCDRRKGAGAAAGRRHLFQISRDKSLLLSPSKRSSLFMATLLRDPSRYPQNVTVSSCTWAPKICPT